MRRPCYQQGGYPPQQPGYAPQQAGYPAAQPSQPAGYGQQNAPPPQQSGYAGQQHGAPSGDFLEGTVGVGLPIAPANWVRKSTNPKLQLSISAKKLADRDLTSKSDPMAVVFIYDVPTSKWYEAGRTEALTDTLNPEWAKTIEVDYFFEEDQKIRVEIYDKDNKSAKLKHHDFLGKAETKLAAIVTGKAGSKGLVNQI
jgi:hypothetical protein